MFWPEIGSGFGKPGGTPPPRFLRSTPLGGFARTRLWKYSAGSIFFRKQTAVSDRVKTSNFIPPILQYNTIQILLSTPHGGFSETIEIIKRLKNTQKLLINNY